MNLTPKQEAFCQAIVAGNSQSEAYRTAYDADNMAPKTVNQRAYEMMGRGDIAARVAELREPVIERARYDLNVAMTEALEALTMGKLEKNPSAMVAAVALRAKLSGLLAEKSAPPLNALESASTDLLLAMLEELKGRRAASEITHAHHT